MAEIKAALVKALRDITNVGMMDCKKALMETNGDKDAAIKLLRERGLAIQTKRADKEANEGIIDAAICDDGKLGVLIEVNCETDFVARNESFQAFVKELLEQSKDLEDGALAEAAKDILADKVAEIGENLIIAANVRYDLQGAGEIFAYIHLGGKVGVLMELGCEKETTVKSDVFKELGKDITLHIAANAPQYLKRDEISEDVLNAEKEIYAKQVEGKPANILDRIVNGKLEKYYSQVCLIEQGFVKDPDQSITALLTDKGKELDDMLCIRRYTYTKIGS